MSSRVQSHCQILGPRRRRRTGSALRWLCGICHSCASGWLCKSCIVRVSSWFVPPLAHCRHSVHVGLRAPLVLALDPAMTFNGLCCLLKWANGIAAIHVAVICRGQEQEFEAVPSRLLHHSVVHAQIAQGGQHGQQGAGGRKREQGAGEDCSERQCRDKQTHMHSSTPHTRNFVRERELQILRKT